MSSTGRWLAAAAAAEALTGLGLVAAPALVVRLLIGDEIAGVAVVLSRVAGLALVGLGLACWPGARGARGGAQAYAGMLAYCAAAGAYLALLGLAGEAAGMLLWPAVAAHAMLAAALALERRTPGQP